MVENLRPGVEMKAPKDVSGMTPEKPLRERVLATVDAKILADPFYTGENSAMWDLATPIRRSRREKDSPGTTPQAMFEEMQREEESKSSTPKDLFNEQKAEEQIMENQGEDITAEEMFWGKQRKRNEQRLADREDSTQGKVLASEYGKLHVPSQAEADAYVDSFIAMVEALQAEDLSTVIPEGEVVHAQEPIRQKSSDVAAEEGEGESELGAYVESVVSRIKTAHREPIPEAAVKKKQQLAEEVMYGPQIQNAEGMFGRTTIIMRNPKSSKRQENWARNWEIAGEYFGTGVTFQEIATRYGLTREAVRLISNGLLNEAVGLKELSAIKPGSGKKNEKPHDLWNRRAELLDPESKLSAFIQDFDLGKDGTYLNNKYGSSRVSLYRSFIEELNIDTKVPYVNRWMNDSFWELLNSLGDSNKPIKERRKAFAGIDYGLYLTHKDKLPITNLTTVARSAGLYLFLSDSKRVLQVLKKAKIYVRSIPHVTQGKTLGYYRLIAEGDAQKAVSVLLREPSLADLRVPTVIAYGKVAPGEIPNTRGLDKLVRLGLYMQDAQIIGKQTRRLIAKGHIKFADIIGEDCPGTLYVLRSGGIVVKAKEREALRAYFAVVEERYLAQMKNSNE